MGLYVEEVFGKMDHLELEVLLDEEYHLYNTRKWKMRKIILGGEKKKMNLSFGRKFFHE